MHDMMKKYPTVDLDFLTGSYVGFRVKLLDNDNIQKAEEWCANTIGDMGDTTWWIAPMLEYKELPEGEKPSMKTVQKLIQVYYFVFLDENMALQFKILGW